jgi:PTH1 family peptidyl-tRNA hydrolase
MKCLIGLGNPGPQYVLNRHNIGFMVIDAINQELGEGAYRTEHRAQVARLNFTDGEKVILVKPQTYMNLSGESVAPLVKFYNVALEEILVIQDDIDQPFMGVRLQKNRGSGGHNGIKSLTQHLASENYARLKLGVGRPSHPQQDVANYVLQNFSADEMKYLPRLIETAFDCVEDFLKVGFDRAANIYNGLKLQKE